MQLSIFEEDIRPGVYRLTTPWTNEMDYTWKHSEELYVLELFSPRACTCALKGGYELGLVFQLSPDRVRKCFRYDRPLPARPDHFSR